MKSAFIFGLSIASAIALSSTSAFGQEAPTATQTNPQEQKLLETARQTATVAGGARYCKLDPDDIEEYISKAYARLSLLARDDYQKVLGRVEFNNILTATSAREPREGCDDFSLRFNKILQQSR